MSRLFTRCNTRRYLRTCLAIGAILATNVSSPAADWQDDVDYDKLVAALGDSVPNGSGVPISLVEAATSVNGPYFPNTANPQFDSAADPLGAAVNFVDGSGGQNMGTSNHANSQAQTIIGNTQGLARAANSIVVYETDNYLGQVLNQNIGDTTEPDTQDFRVQNFSWIGTFQNDANDRELLRRFDYVVNRDNITAIVGVHNNANPLPHLLSHSYNGVSVGRNDGSHSPGLTRLNLYGTGRSKPEIVAPRTSTSAATSSVSSVATLLHSASSVLGTDAAKSQTMKAILLSGAQKEFSVRDSQGEVVSEFDAWSQFDSSGDWHPLDDTYGAGQVNVYNSFRVAESGQAIGSTSAPTPVNRHGWDFQTVEPGTGSEILYDFVIPSGSTAEELSITLAWNAIVEDPISSPINFNTADLLVADLALELVDSQGLTVDLDLSDNHAEGLSDSSVDNLEHIYLENLAAGTYTLKVSSNDLTADFGLAWRTETLFDTFSADFDADGDVDGVDFLAWQQGSGTLVNATISDGDADGDGDVDEDDLAIYYAAADLNSLPPSIRSVIAVPEPNLWGLMYLLLMCLPDMFRKSQRRLADPSS